MSPEQWLECWNQVAAKVGEGADERQEIERLLAATPEQLTPDQFVAAVKVANCLEKYDMEEVLLSELTSRVSYIPSIVLAAAQSESEVVGTLRGVLRYHARFNSDALGEAISAAATENAHAVNRLLGRA